MRQRKIKNLEEKLDAFDAWIVDDPSSMKGRWSEVFGCGRPIWLEIGCGKGQFIRGCAQARPDDCFIAVEGHQSVVLRALEKAEEAELSNLRFVLEYIKDIRDLFADGELAGIYLNFSDPWPKERHAKRRLTYGKRLLQYRQVIADGGFICFKTDNDGLFDFTLEQIEEEGMEIAEMSRDLHSSPYAEGNITTEYEDKFAGAGKNINYVKIRV
ncbi:MAG: tRNA (guanosine(46)-N7)-methyltransferase TrmB [Emergencia sp.]